ncbi:hypothetical protein E4U43_005728 [Claviceps pusilla]|uniref:Mtf2-like C-terminal domain-containing protein n=1 Tax=Claviceps pusilla TaxID=123648 RepID=A0A9P7N468_9HYPO|nr:hypothetical protein E4U43_005728 [Claviceps pusilla]
MSSTLLPFLYQTRTIQRALRNLRTQHVLQPVRLVHVPRRGRSRKPDNAIPFQWDHDSPREWIDNDVAAADKPSTITPSEAEIFKSIFDDIAQGRMPSAKKRSSTSGAAPASQGTSEPTQTQQPHAQQAATGMGMARSIVEQARVMEFREKFLRRYPSSLRTAAQVALGLYELEPGTGSVEESKMMELDEADKAKWAERAKYERLRTEERERVDALMTACDTDVALWRVMEAEVFSLPARLGILQLSMERAKPRRRMAVLDPAKPKRRVEKKSVERSAKKSDEKDDDKGDDKSTKSSTKRSTKKSDDKSDAQQRTPATKPDEPPAHVADEKRVMDVHGPLYPHFINRGLELFDTAFARPSDYAFDILPRVKSLGLPSYVLGVSSPFYTRLARMHWTRFGDAVSALDVLQEMNSVGLYADEGARELLVMMRDHLHGCAWGAQGPFVMGMMDAPPYDASLTQRLEEMEAHAVRSMAANAL